MSLPSLGVPGKVAFVTGTGSGLGRAISIGLAQAGADIAATELPDKLDSARETIREVEKAGRRGLAVPLDVSKLPMIGEAIDAAIKHFGRIDILVNNAGINIPRLAVDVSEAEWDKIMAIDLKGVFFVTQAAAKKAFIPQGGGKVVNIASQMGVVGYTYRSAYCAAKAGVVNLTRVLAFEWAKLKINVNTVAPTFVDTPLTRPMFENKEFYNDVISRIPMGRLATPEDIVGAVVYLASPAADMVTGHTLLVDGGWTAV
ncbi:MAG: glucose 1-dehydrogenase [Planctomycetes bacterium]|nr:glucose 1-dehydrogenase [Planctomycetota bacterium]